VNLVGQRLSELARVLIVRIEVLMPKSPSGSHMRQCVWNEWLVPSWCHKGGVAIHVSVFLSLIEYEEVLRILNSEDLEDLQHWL